MKKILLITLLSSTLLLTACTSNSKNSANAGNGIEQETRDDRVEVPIEDFEVIITPANKENSDTFPNYEIKNNSKYTLLTFDAIYTNKNNKEQQGHTFLAQTILPGETSKKDMFYIEFFDEDADFNFDDFVLESINYKYITEDNVEHELRYDAKIDRYSEY